jgi:hypothetical protein
MRRFSMSLSGGVKALTWVVVLLAGVVPLLVWSLVPGGPIGGPRGPGGPGVGAARWASLEIEGGELRILRRAWRSAAYPLSSVEEVALLPPRALAGAVRTFGNGGLFGYYGWFYRKGAFRLFATRSDRLVEVVAGGKRVVVSPDEPGRFVEGLLATAPRARLRQPAGDPGAASATRRS